MSDVDVLLCEYPGCDRRGMGCWLPDDDEEPTDWFCDEHAIAAGYCSSCRTFWLCAGIDSFDFSRTPGLCENCSAGEDYDDEADEDDYERWCQIEDERDY